MNEKIERTKRRRFLQIATVALLGLGLAQWSAAVAAADTTKPAKPNIIIVMPDDLGYGDYACLGNPISHTPVVDAFKKESLLFTRYHASPTCSPSRATLMSGRHEFMSGVTHTLHQRKNLSLDTVTLPQVLKTVGYTTGIFGKWHLGDEAPYQPENRGFDEAFIGIHKIDPTIYHNGKLVKNAKGYSTDLFFGQAIQWMDTKRQEKMPFFAWITPNAAHGPFNGKQGTPNDDYKKYLGRTGVTENIAKSYWMLENIDMNFGLLLDKLKEWGIADNTLVIYLGSDNGGGAGLKIYNAGMKGHKGTADQGGTRIPVFFRWPAGNIPAGVECEALTSQIDILPTLAEIAGVTLTDDPIKQQIEGRSLMPLLKNPKADWEYRILVHHAGRWEDGQAVNSKYSRCSIQDDRFTLVRNEELYDLKADPGETKNVITQYPEEVAKLRAVYDEWWTRVQPRLVNEDAYKKAGITKDTDKPTKRKKDVE